MATEELKPIDEVVKLINSGRNFVLQGGAGSGKTEALKDVIHQLTKNSKKRIACITHTNKAADEILSRVDGDFEISTIHAFLSALIKPFRANIKCVFSDLFILQEFSSRGCDYYDGDEKLQKKLEYERFKKLFNQLSSLKYKVTRENSEKVVGKRDYDKDPLYHNEFLNLSIQDINNRIVKDIESRDAKDFSYNETRFDSYRDSTFGHDGLIIVACLLFEKYPVLGRVLSNRYDCIFIDEYQDTSSEIIQSLLRTLPKNSNLVVGLFGDSEQAIYSDGIGSAQYHIDSNELVLVEKIDNYRCSPQVITFSKQFRSDGLDQKVALKVLEDGSTESYESREGSVKFFYALSPENTNITSNKEGKEARMKALNDLVEKVQISVTGFVHLKLTNKSVASDAGFGELYSIFSDRYFEPREQIKKILERLQFGQVAELIELFESLSGDKCSYNKLISMIKKRGFSIRTVADKAKLELVLKSLSSMGKGAYEVIEYAIEKNLISQSESHGYFINKRNLLLRELESDPAFCDFESLYSKGHTTQRQMEEALQSCPTCSLTADKLKSDYSEMLNNFKAKRFYNEFFSGKLSFAQILAFYRYENDDSNFVTMHKTKGTGIENVLIVLDEYGWTAEYDFLSCFSGKKPQSAKEIASRKLLYVACSRTRKNLICVRLVSDQLEADEIARYFSKEQVFKLTLGSSLN